MTAPIPPTETALGDTDACSNKVEDTGRAEDLLVVPRREKGGRSRSGRYSSDLESIVRRALAQFWCEQRVGAEAEAAGLPVGETWGLVRAAREAAGEGAGIRLACGQAVRLWWSPLLRAELRQIEDAAGPLRTMILAGAHLLRRREAAVLVRLGRGETCEGVRQGEGRSGVARAAAVVFEQHRGLAGSAPGNLNDCACEDAVEQHLRRAEWLARRAMTPDVLKELMINSIPLIVGRERTPESQLGQLETDQRAPIGRAPDSINTSELIIRTRRSAAESNTESAWKADGGPEAVLVEELCRLANAPYCPGVDHPLVRAAVLKLWAMRLYGQGERAVGGAAVYRWALCRARRRELAMLPVGETEAARAESFREAHAAALGDEADATYWVLEHVRAARAALNALPCESAGEARSSADEVAAGGHDPARPAAVRKSAGRGSATVAALNRRQHEVLRAVAEDAGRAITIAEHQREQGVAFATARTDLLELSARGLLVQRKAGRMFVFVSPAAAGAAHVATGASDESPPAEQRAKAGPVTPTPRVRATSSNDFGYEL